MELAQSPLSEHHRQAGAKVGEFAGWEMPISFAGTVAEHAAVREAVGVFDVSHLGTVWVTGQTAPGTVDRSFTNDAGALADGRSQYTLCATPEGGVVDDLIVYRLTADRWLVVPNAANTAAVVARLNEQAHDDTAVDDQSHAWTVLAVQGPASLALVERVLDIDAAALSFGDVVELPDARGLLCRTGYTGELGVELVVPAATSAPTWSALLDAGAVPCGLGARDTLRLELGYPLHGNELSREISPYEARCGWAVRLDGRDFVGREALAAAKQQATERRILGLVTTGRRPPRPGMSVSRDGQVVGSVTSGSFSPTRGCGIGLALLDRSVEDGARLQVDVRGTEVPFTAVTPPMVDRGAR